MNADAIETARVASCGVHAARAAAASERNKAADLELRLEAAERARERLRTEKDEHAARRLLDDATGDKPHGNSADARSAKARDERLADLDEEIPALAAAIKLQSSRIATAQGAIAAPQLPFVAAVLDVDADMRGEAVNDIRNGLAALAPAFARLVAADQLRSATIGDRFTLPDGCSPPIGGVPLFRSFAKGVPERLRPPELTETALFAAAHEISREIIVYIKGEV